MSAFIQVAAASHFAAASAAHHTVAFGSDATTLAIHQDWAVLKPLFVSAIWQTLIMVVITLLIGGLLGLVVGGVLWGTRPGGLFANRIVYRILDVIINIIDGSNLEFCVEDTGTGVLSEFSEKIFSLDNRRVYRGDLNADAETE